MTYRRRTGARRPPKKPQGAASGALFLRKFMLKLYDRDSFIGPGHLRSIRCLTGLPSRHRFEARGRACEPWRGNGRHLERGGQNRRDHVEHWLDHEDRERGGSIQENCLRQRAAAGRSTGQQHGCAKGKVTALRLLHSRDATVISPLRL
jgi:hypothetical protein